MTAAFFLDHFLRFFYAPTSGPWYAGNVWGNVVAITILAPCGWLWAQTRFWPLYAVHDRLRRLEAHHRRAHEHRRWEAAVLARIHREQTGEPAPEHPHFGDPEPRAVRRGSPPETDVPW